VPIEVEVKLRLPDAAAARTHLLALGAKPLGAGLEEDLFFHHPSRDLAAHDEALRLRRSPYGTELTFKGPRGPGPIKARTELTLQLAAGDDPDAFLLALGFTLGPRVRKLRESYRIDGLTVTLDDVEEAGSFAEVEAMATDAAHGEAQVEALLQRLGWQEWPREPRPYVAIVEARRRSRTVTRA